MFSLLLHYTFYHISCVSSLHKWKTTCQMFLHRSLSAVPYLSWCILILSMVRASVPIDHCRKSITFSAFLSSLILHITPFLSFSIHPINGRNVYIASHHISWHHSPTRSFSRTPSTAPHRTVLIWPSVHWQPFLSLPSPSTLVWPRPRKPLPTPLPVSLSLFFSLSFSLV